MTFVEELFFDAVFIAIYLVLFAPVIPLIIYLSYWTLKHSEDIGLSRWFAWFLAITSPVLFPYFSYLFITWWLELRELRTKPSYVFFVYAAIVVGLFVLVLLSALVDFFV